MSSFNTLVAIAKIFTLRNTQMTLVHPVRGAGVHALSKFQVSSLSRKDSERVSLEMVGDRRAKRPSCAASRVSELRLAVEVAARPGEKLDQRQH